MTGVQTCALPIFGNLLAASADQLLTFAALLLLLAVSVGIAYRPLLYSSINAPVAEANGVPVRFLSVVFMVLLGLAVTMAVQAVGTLLLFALLVAPVKDLNMAPTLMLVNCSEQDRRPKNGRSTK